MTQLTRIYSSRRNRPRCVLNIIGEKNQKKHQVNKHQGDTTLSSKVDNSAPPITTPPVVMGREQVGGGGGRRGGGSGVWAEPC